MKIFAFFFMSVIIIFMIVQRIHKNKDILQITSTIDGREYIVRKLPDGKDAAERLANINKKVLLLIGSLKEEDREGISMLKDNFNPDRLSETGLGAKYTSYSVNKGEDISSNLNPCSSSTDSIFFLTTSFSGLFHSIRYLVNALLPTDCT